MFKSRRTMGSRATTTVPGGPEWGSEQGEATAGRLGRTERSGDSKW